MKEEEKKDSFVFYRSFYESIKNLDKDTQIELFISICEYSLNEQEPTDLSPIANAMFTVIKPIIDSANTRYKTSIENGKNIWIMSTAVPDIMSGTAVLFV